MRELHRRASGSDAAAPLSVRRLKPWQANILYQQAVPCALATLQVVSPLARLALCSDIFEFVRFSKTLDGLKSVLLSAITAVKYSDARFAKVGLAIWRSMATPRYLSTIKRSIPIVDVSRSQISFLTAAQLASLSEGELVSNPLELGAEAADGPSQSCLKGYTIASAVLGGVGGALIAGTAVQGKSNSIVDISGAGGFIVGILGGAQGGNSIAQALCTNISPGTLTGIASGLFGGEPPPNTPDDEGFNAGFSAGWAAATGGGPTASGAGANYNAGFAAGQAVASLINTPTTVTNPDGSTTTTAPDGTITTVLPDGSTTISNIDGATTTISPDGTVTTTTPDGTTSTNSPDGTISTTTPDGTTTTNSPDGTTATTAPDGTTTTTAPDGTTTKTTADGTTTTQEPDGTTTRTDPDAETTTTEPDGGTITTEPDGGTMTAGGEPDPDGPDDVGPPIGPGIGPVSVNSYPSGLGLSGLITSNNVGTSFTYNIGGLPQMAVGGGLSTAGILAGLGE